ncbi:MAG: divergent polysaccharide deacetylase family protein [Motiliproteus sp.]
MRVSFFCCRSRIALFSTLIALSVGVSQGASTDVSAGVGASVYQNVSANAGNRPEKQATERSLTDSVDQPSVVIIIDDVGDNFALGLAAVELPGPVTFAFLPHSPFGPRLAKKAFTSGKDVILHAPMQNTHDRPLGPGALTVDLNRQQFGRVLAGDLDDVPHVQGLNNHMGSLLTTLEPQMNWVMDEVDQRGLFFIDSRTTSDSVAWQVARNRGIPSLRRDVFLDHERTTEFVHQQFMLTLDIAKRYGSAIAIGHPYPVTVEYLKLALPLLDEQGIRLVTASALIMEKQERYKLAQLQQPQQPQQRHAQADQAQLR